MSRDPAQWVMALGDYSGKRYSALDQINRENVKDLKVAWSFSTGVLRGHEGGAAGGRRHDVRPHAVPQHGLRARPQGQGPDPLAVRAAQDPNVIPVMCCDTVNRGVAYADGKIFLHQADTTLVALDAKTGEDNVEGRERRRRERRDR